MFELDIRGACGLWSNVGFGANIFKAICIVNPNEICIRGVRGVSIHTYCILLYMCVYIYIHTYLYTCDRARSAAPAWTFAWWVSVSKMWRSGDPEKTPLGPRDQDVVMS